MGKRLFKQSAIGCIENDLTRTDFRVFERYAVGPRVHVTGGNKNPLAKTPSREVKQEHDQIGASVTKRIPYRVVRQFPSCSKLDPVARHTSVLSSSTAPRIRPGARSLRTFSLDTVKIPADVVPAQVRPEMAR